MKKITKNIFYLFVAIFFFSGCQSVKEGLTGQKKSNSDEFLIEKKNPLVLPPEFDELPEPKTLTEEEKNDEEEIDLENIIKKSKTNTISVDINSDNTLENSILEKIKKN
jgi:hypothetical protein